MPLPSNEKTFRQEDAPCAIYLYCIGSFSRLQTVSGPGIDEERPLLLFPYRELAAVVSMVELSEFSGPSAASRMEDLQWIGPRAWRHQSIIEKTMQSSPVLPLHFGTIFHSFESLEERLRRHHGEILKFLLHTSGKEEWSVKGLISLERAREVLCNQKLAEAADSLSPSPGTRHFQEQRLRMAAERSLNQWLQDLSEGISRNLIELGTEIRMRKIFPRGLLGDDRDMFLNWAILVPRELTLDVHACLECANAEYSRYDASFSIGGPWPPYSFCPTLDGEV